jgi:hypothetical protein
MLSTRLGDIDAVLLDQACAESWPESQTLEFKRQLPAKDDSGRVEFLKDVSALANAEGGDLVFGIAEVNAKASQIQHISAKSDPIDATRRRLGQILEAGVEPRINGIEFKQILGPTGDYVLIIRVPDSFQKPHRYRVDAAATRWVIRQDTHVVDLTYDQIRNAFDRGATLAERARRLREERLSQILIGRVGVPMPTGPRCVVHLTPIAAMAGSATADVARLYNDYQHFMFRDWGGATRDLNLDGLLVHPGKTAAYVQIFRSSALEAVRTVCAINNPGKFIPSLTASGFVRDAVNKFIAALRSWNINGPALLSVALVDVGEYQLAYENVYSVTSMSGADRPNLILPEVWIPRVEAIDNVDTLVQPLLDIMWQSFGLQRCEFFSVDGKWMPQ